jgi:TonB family protein
MDRLKRRSSEAASLYDLYSRLVRETFKEKGFYKNSPEVDRDLQQAGNLFLGELQSGKYDKGLSGDYLSANSFKTLLEDYRGVRHDSDPGRLEGRAEVDDVTKEILAHYVAPIYPPLALAAAVQGAVQLVLDVNESGQVQNVVVVNGNPLLTESAKIAAMQWKFKPQPQTKVQATLQYVRGAKCD